MLSSLKTTGRARRGADRLICQIQNARQCRSYHGLPRINKSIVDTRGVLLSGSHRERDSSRIFATGISQVPRFTTAQFSTSRFVLNNSTGNGDGSNGKNDDLQKVNNDQINESKEKELEKEKEQENSVESSSSGTGSEDTAASQTSGKKKSTTSETSKRSRRSLSPKVSESESATEAAAPTPLRKAVKPSPSAASILFADSNTANSQGSSDSSSGGNNSNNASENGNAKKQPISPLKQVLPVVLSHRPVFPGLAVHCNSTDETFIAAIDALEKTKSWDRTVVAFLRKPVEDEEPTVKSSSSGTMTGSVGPSASHSTTTQLMTNVEEAYSVGCVCRVETIEVTASDGKLIFNSSLFPLYRVRAGELTEPVKDAPVIRQSAAILDADTGLDVTSFDKAAEEPNNGSSEESVGSNGSTDGSATSEPAVKPSDIVNVHWMKGITAVSDEPYAVDDRAIQELCFKIIDVLYSISNTSYPLKVQVEKFSKLVRRSPGEDFQKPDFLADFCAALCSGDKEIQAILETANIKTRLEASLDLLNRELLSIKMHEKISKAIAEQTAQRQREFILQEQYKYIKKELGMDDEKGKLAQKFLERADALAMPEEVRKVFDEELAKFRGLESTAGEYSTVKSYLDWLVSLPWGKFSTDKFDLNAAKKLLDDQHFGLKEVKDRILEFIAVAKLSGSVDGKILCFAGPPGVGKTSVARSIAEALNRKFDRFSVGGLYDASEIKGHRRTYVAALPGKIIQALKKCETQNPVILIDEIDKVGTSSVHGDPSAALLEVLDPEQNKNFQDIYLDVPVDISKILFICTANTLDTLPQPLKDRMEIIHIPGYVNSEKVSIAEGYLTPSLRKKSGLENVDIKLSSDALLKLVTSYTRESGVRGLNKILEKIYRKVAYNVVIEKEKDTPPIASASESAAEAAATETASESKDAVADQPKSETVVTADAKEVAPEPIDPELLKDYHLEINVDDLTKYVGAPLYNTVRLYEKFPPGVTMGLAYTPLGGVPLFVETVLQQPLDPKSTPKLTRTGHLGEVMNESSSIAYSFSRMYMVKRFLGNRFLDHAVLHTHFPEGAVKKDGPSAGIAMATSLISLALNKPVNPDVCMTGEITLTGKVLQIGGLREKSAAAKAAGSKIIVFPKDNMAEWEDLPEMIREGLTPMPVSWYDEVFDIAFGQVDQAEIESMWSKELATKDVDNSTLGRNDDAGFTPPPPPPPSNRSPSLRASSPY
ncbi:ATP-dependent Lon protease PIM1 [Sugiyamaella lignohabitans]|uniref:Lon protease homolog n=1 Tax=Sugiyamaella lignohabitans TaxID=796027 RepID=A0A167EV24_9ASCO|nr:ATP-dependent Lon protease PIM1 [Sugiyamaella lignohabitans]ANB14495.1 ATP-dependent Lon protease PIM1 [Sugiyamaella lignohabitans]